MTRIEIKSEDLDLLHNKMMSDLDANARKKCMVVYLKGIGHSHIEIAKIVRVNQDTVTNYINKYATGGIHELLKDNYYKPTSKLDSHIDKLKRIFEQEPPHTVNHAIDIIEKNTGICLKHSACREFLKRIGMKCRCTGLIPGKAVEDEQQQQAQKTFHDDTLQPLLEEAKQGKRTVLFVDAAHFVMGAFLGMVWCFLRVLLPSSCGRKRYNVLGAFNPINHEVVTIKNETYINHVVICELLVKISQAYNSYNRPISLVLDNARYQKCQSIFEKARELNIELVYLPAYSQNLNLIERLWRFVKNQVLYSKYYERFSSFKQAIDTCLDELHTKYKEKMETLMTMKFQLFSKS